MYSQIGEIYSDYCRTDFLEKSVKAGKNSILTVASIEIVPLMLVPHTSHYFLCLVTAREKGHKTLSEGRARLSKPRKQIMGKAREEG